MRTFISIFIVCICFSQWGYAQELLSLEQCRRLAIENNKSLKIKEKDIDVASYTHRAAKTNFLPKLSVAGGYLRNGQEMSLISNDTKSLLNNMGTNGAQLLQKAASTNSELANLLGSIQSPELVGTLNQAGQKLVDDFRTDTRNIFVGAVILEQPIYMGGKIRAYNDITKFAEQLAKTQHNLALQEVILSVDEAYWQVVSLTSKRKLAHSYLNLLNTLQGDITKAKKVGIATKADVLRVKVKTNSAELMLTKVDDGLVLSKMVLCQLCGLKLDSKITLYNQNMTDDGFQNRVNSKRSLNQIFGARPEIKGLEYAHNMQLKNVQIVRSDYLPNIALIGSYYMTNPSVSNGFENKFNGDWSLGIMLKMPIWSWREGHFKVKAAKAKADKLSLQLLDAKEKISLQVSQANFKVKEAEKLQMMSNENMKHAVENLRTANLGYKEGLIPMSDLLEAQTMWLAAKSSVLDAQISCQLTRTYLQKANGELAIK